MLQHDHPGCARRVRTDSIWKIPATWASPRWSLVLAAVVAGSACGGPDFDSYQAATAQPRETTAWQAYGGPGGTKYSALTQIDRTNVARLEVGWVYRTGDASEVFQNTPILVDGRLVLCSPLNKVIALDPLTGGELWRHDPGLDTSFSYANNTNCRGVAQWTDPDAAECPVRILTATNDARLLALDATTGGVCAGFGANGSVDLAAGVGEREWPGEYQVTSPPAVVGDLVVVGSAVSDNNRVTAPSGVVRAYSARSGALVWAFDLAPPDFDRTRDPVSDHGYALGTPNVWAPMSVDAERDMVFLPTGNPSPDYYRSGKPDMDYYGSAVVALRASTGEVLWHFSTVVNDFWDYDVPSQPVLVDLVRNGQSVPALVQSTKMGFVFVLNRETGAPLVDVAYREVPINGPLADRLSPVQPFPPEAFRVSRTYEAGASMFGLCDDLEAESVIGPVYTPITERWTIGLPSNMGATNWGGVAVDPVRGRIAARTSSVPFRTRLIARSEAADLLAVPRDRSLTREERLTRRRAMEQRFQLPEGTEIALQDGTDFLMARHPFLDPVIGIPCAGPPLGEALVIDINEHRQVWRRPHGTTRELTVYPFELGMPGVGGPLLTAGGLMFAAGIEERALRAYDSDTGAELWRHALPRAGNATPMTYAVTTAAGSRQMVVIAAGGDDRVGLGETGDYVIGFALSQ